MNAWKSISVFLAGMVAGLLVFLRLKQHDVTAETYIREQELKVGKIKQRGEGNQQTVQLQQKSRKKLREQRRKIRKEKRAVKKQE